MSTRIAPAWSSSATLSMSFWASWPRASPIMTIFVQLTGVAGTSPRRCLRPRVMKVAGRFITSSSIAGMMSGKGRWGYYRDSAAVHFRQLSAVGQLRKFRGPARIAA
jgi:hypothetical protein